MKLLKSLFFIAILYTSFVHASEEVEIEDIDEPIVEKVSVENEPPELQPPPIQTNPEPELDIESILTATIDWKSNAEHKLLYGKDNEVSLVLRNKYHEPLTIFTVTGTLSSTKVEEQPRPLTPQRILSAAAPHKATVITYRPRPELEPGEYEFEVFVEVISPKVIRLHRINAFKGKVIIHDPSSRFFDAQSITIYALLVILIVLIVPPLRRAALSPLLAPKKKVRSEESKSDDWIPAHVKLASPTSATAPSRRRKTVGGVDDGANS